MAKGKEMKRSTYESTWWPFPSVRLFFELALKLSPVWILLEADPQIMT
jgi:hypothetical protein